MKDQDSDQVGQFTRISHLLRKAGHKPDDAVELTERLSNMASSNVLDRIDNSSDRLNSKMDANTVRLESKIDAQNSKHNVLIWAIGFAGLVISAAIIFS